VINFLKDTARIRVMLWQDFKQELETILKQANFISGNVSNLFAGTQKDAAPKVQAASLAEEKLVFPTQLPNPYATGSKYFADFKRFVLDQSQSPYGNTYLDLWNLLKYVYERQEQAHRDGSRFQIEHLAWHIVGSRANEYEGLDWQLACIRYYCDQDQLVQVEYPPAAARTTPPDYKSAGYRVDIHLTNNILVDTKAWAQSAWENLDIAEKPRWVNKLRDQIYFKHLKKLWFGAFLRFSRRSSHGRSHRFESCIAY
jgi:hypothetical protein